MNRLTQTEEWIKKAFKKLKGAVYLDKTQFPLVDQLVSFEENDATPQLTRLAEMLTGADDIWADYVSDILQGIDVLVYPKKLKEPLKNQVIFNTDNEPVELEKAQYFIHMPVIGHILGTLWALTIGYRLDNRNDPDYSRMYEHSYGNRLRKNLYHPESGDITFSPYLFEPYFSQYEGWRDRALEYAKERLKDKQDALILTLDLRSFFYGVHIPRGFFDKIYQDLSEEKSLPDWTKRIHDFVYCVMQAYSESVRCIHKDEELVLGERVFLPIGFLPSYILSNWVLTPFDEKIIERFNPVYYGRYVDDIIIVDKVEKNSPLRKKALGEGQSKLTAKDVIEYYFCSCPVEKNMLNLCNPAQLFVSLNESELTPKQKEDYQKARAEHEKSDQNPKTVYRINSDVFPCDTDTITSDIQIQNDKVKVFYFREGATKALLDCFRTQIGRNASEFRFLPDMEPILGNNDYSEIFKLHSDETPHKLRGVSDVSLDKFSLSKFLGKYRKAGNMIRDKKETAFDRELSTFLSKRTLIENYTLWERLLEIMIANDQLKTYEKLAKNILSAIADYQVPPDIMHSKQHGYQALLLTLRTAVCRTSALCWGPKMSVALVEIQKVAERLFPEKRELFRAELLTAQRVLYCQSRMVNKYILPLPVGRLDHAIFELKEGGCKDINLCHLEEFRLHVDPSAKLDYMYYPYMVTPQEISFALACKNIADGKRIENPEEQRDEIENLYRTLNYPNLTSNSSEISLTEVKANAILKIPQKTTCYAVSVDSPKTKKIKVGIGNARLDHDDFKGVLTGKPNRSYKRYQQVSCLLKAAIKEHVDLLVLPESFLPWEWVPDISRLCANNQMALVTGIEHILSVKEAGKPQKVYNLTAVILPYQKDDYKFAHVVYHHKVHYAPNEIREIKGYRMKPVCGKEYQLFHWKDLWFSVYCCFELASIVDRALFQSYADLTVAVEWNRDVPYFSNIMESLCRDLHCYCIQVNSSDYGDSRVMSPTRTELRDLIKTKGGLNYTILTDVIDIDQLRDYQRKEYELQRDDSRFKPTPPNFNPSIPEQKQNGTLWESLTGKC